MAAWRSVHSGAVEGSVEWKTAVAACPPSCYGCYRRRRQHGGSLRLSVDCDEPRITAFCQHRDYTLAARCRLAEIGRPQSTGLIMLTRCSVGHQLFHSLRLWVS